MLYSKCTSFYDVRYPHNHATLVIASPQAREHVTSAFLNVQYLASFQYVSITPLRLQNSNFQEFLRDQKKEHRECHPNDAWIVVSDSCPKAVL